MLRISSEPFEPVETSTTEAVKPETTTIKRAVEQLPSVQTLQIGIRGADRIKTCEDRPRGRRQPAAILKHSERTQFQQIVFASPRTRILFTCMHAKMHLKISREITTCESASF